MSYLAALAFLHTCLLLSNGAAVGLSDEPYYTLATRLMEHLLGEGAAYKADVRPSKQVYIGFSITLKSLKKMSIETESMFMKYFATMTWYDPRLAWNPPDYGNITDILFHPEDIWVPPLYVFNKVTAEGLVRSNVYPEGTYEGLVTWGQEMATKTECKVSTRQYPFDTQWCTIKFSLYSSMSKMDFVTDDNLAFDGLYSENGEWDVVLMNISRMDVEWSGVSQLFPVLGYTYQLTRRKSYYQAALIIPITLLSVLIVSVFCVPVQSGERVSYCLTVLLTYTLFLSIVSNDLPPIATDISILQVYLAICMAMGVIATLLTIIVQCVHYRGSSLAPHWLSSLSNCFLLPIRRHCRSRCSLCSSRKTGVTDELHGNSSRASDVADHVMRERLSYEEVANALDRFFFVIFFVAMVVVSAMFTRAMDAPPVPPWQ